MTDQKTYKETRIQKGYTQPEAAYKLGVTEETISRRENGAHRITLEAWAALKALPPKHATDYMVSFTCTDLAIKAIPVDTETARYLRQNFKTTEEKDRTDFADGSSYTQVMIWLKEVPTWSDLYRFPNPEHESLAGSAGV